MTLGIELTLKDSVFSHLTPYGTLFNTYTITSFTNLYSAAEIKFKHADFCEKVSGKREQMRPEGTYINPRAIVGSKFVRGKILIPQ